MCVLIIALFLSPARVARSLTRMEMTERIQ